MDAVERLAAEMRGAAMEIAQEVVAEGLANDAVPSLPRIGEVARLGDVPIFVVELARQVSDPQEKPVGRGSSLAALARDHARSREELGFAPREVVTEFLLLRRCLWRFVARRSGELTPDELLALERRLNDTLDELVAECVVAYFDRATADLAAQARRDPLTGLLNHPAFTSDLDEELVRARRYDRPAALVFFDVDRFKQINDTLGHPEGDRVLRLVAAVLRETMRRSDFAGRMGGDEFAVCLVESDGAAGLAFIDRVRVLLSGLEAGGELPRGFSISPGVAARPDDGEDVSALFRVADERSYAVKRAR